MVRQAHHEVFGGTQPLIALMVSLSNHEGEPDLKSARARLGDISAMPEHRLNGPLRRRSRPHAHCPLMDGRVAVREGGHGKIAADPGFRAGPVEAGLCRRQCRCAGERAAAGCVRVGPMPRAAALALFIIVLSLLAIAAAVLMMGN